VAVRSPWSVSRFCSLNKEHFFDLNVKNTILITFSLVISFTGWWLKWHYIQNKKRIRLYEIDRSGNNNSYTDREYPVKKDLSIHFLSGRRKLPAVLACRPAQIVFLVNALMYERTLFFCFL